MDRLTYWDDDGKHGKMKPGASMSQRVLDRLAAYEDTGLTPEEYRAYVKWTNVAVWLKCLDGSKPKPKAA